MQIKKMRLAGLVVLMLSFFIVNAESALTECAAESDVRSALASAERRAAESIGKTEARQLVEELKRSGVKQSDGTICFTDRDFARFGSLVSAFFREHESASSVRQQQFDFTGQSQPRAENRCVCRTCPKDHNSHCAKNGSAICCPQYCANIFRAVSLAALAGVEGSGLDTCCEDGRKACPRPQVQRRGGAPPKRAKTGSTPPPELDFGDENDDAVVFQTNSTPLGGFASNLMGSFDGRRTVTPSPSVPPSPSMLLDDDARAEAIAPTVSASPSLPGMPSTVPSLAPSPRSQTDPKRDPTPTRDRRTPVEVDVLAPSPSITGPPLPPVQDSSENFGMETLPGEEEEGIDAATLGGEEDIRESPEGEEEDGER